MRSVRKLLTITFLLFLLFPVAVKAELENFTYDDKGKQDPFLHLVSATGSIINFDGELLITDMVLEGIIAGEEGNNVAIINGIIVKVNDELGPYKVQKVGSDTVVLGKDQERFVLKLQREE